MNSGTTITDLHSTVERITVDRLNYASYAHNRRVFPNVSPERWEKVFGPQVKEMEKKFQAQLGCFATVVRGTWDADGYRCGKSVIGESGLCAEHLAENGI